MVKDNKLEKGLAYWTEFTPVENVVLQSEELFCRELDFSPEKLYMFGVQRIAALQSKVK